MHPGLADADALAQRGPPAEHGKKALPVAEQGYAVGEGEKSHSLQGDCVGSGHRPLDLQVSSAADKEGMVTPREVLPLAVLAKPLMFQPAWLSGHHSLWGSI